MLGVGGYNQVGKFHVVSHTREVVSIIINVLYVGCSAQGRSEQHPICCSLWIVSHSTDMNMEFMHLCE
jgi:hypothetical protein